MPKVLLKDVVARIKDKVDKDNTDLEYYIGGEHFDYGEICVTKKAAIKGSTIGPAFHMRFKPGDVLLMSRNPHLRKAGVVDFEGLCSDVSYVCRTKDESVLMQRFLPFIFQTEHFWDFAEKNKHGSTNYFLNWTDFEKYEFDLPTIDVQKELTELLWAAQELKLAYREMFARTDELVKSQFIEMFYGKGYPVKTIGDVIDKKIARVAKVFGKTDKIQYLDISSIDNVSKEVTGLTPYTLSDAPSRAQYILKAGDILYSTVRPNLQNIAINPYNEDNIIGSTGFCVLRCLTVRTGYLWGVVNSILFTDAMVKKASGANYPAVTDKVVHAYEIPIPPEEAQIAYEQLVKQSDKSKFVINKYMNKKYGKIRRQPDVYRI